MDELRKILEDMIEGACTFLQDKAMTMSEELKSVVEATDAELPPLACGIGNQAEWAKARLAKQSINTPDVYITALSDCEFGYEEYKQLGENDGMLYAVARIATDVLKDNELSTKAMNALYSG